MNRAAENPGKRFGAVWDERQQQLYHRVNSRGFNIAWVLLLAAILIQVIVYPREPLRWAVEIGLFLILNGYMTVAYLRRGLWTKTQQNPTARQSVLAGLVAAVLVTLLSTMIPVLTGREIPSYRFLALQALVVFLAAVGILSLLGAYHRRKARQVDATLDEEEEA